MNTSRRLLIGLVALATLAAGVVSQATASPKHRLSSAGTGPVLKIRVHKGRHAISPLIYGANFASPQLIRQLGITVNRWGGNSTSRYNWKNDFYNTGSDWYFEDIHGSSADTFIDRSKAAGANVVLTLPMLGWVSKTSNTGHPFACGFKVSKYGPQDGTDTYDPDCGNGLHSGVPISGNDPLDTSLAIDQSWDSDWIKHLRQAHGTAAHGGVRFYELDNEPSLWNSTHRDVRPDPYTYEELRSLTQAYGTAVKAADPKAMVVGPSEWGWCAYFFSPSDPGGCSDGSDRMAHGDTPLVPWYLARMRAYEQANGTRVLDYLDLHYYPQASGVALTADNGSPATRALRLRSTRSLWDPTYSDESWINSMSMGPVKLIPRMRAWVRQNYPGTKLAITEYNWGATESLNGALAEADVLGIFGRERLGLATLWGTPSVDDPAAYAFRMYRNYDGKGGRFGSTAVSATSGDQDRLAVYAAQRGAHGALTLLVINKSTASLRSRVDLAGFRGRRSAGVYTYSASDLGRIVKRPAQHVGSGGFTRTFPASSITLIVIKPRSS